MYETNFYHLSCGYVDESTKRITPAHLWLAPDLKGCHFSLSSKQSNSGAHQTIAMYLNFGGLKGYKDWAAY